MVPTQEASAAAVVSLSHRLFPDILPNRLAVASSENYPGNKLACKQGHEDNQHKFKTTPNSKCNFSLLFPEVAATFSRVPRDTLEVGPV